MIYSLFNRLLGLKRSRVSKSPVIPKGWPLQTPQQKRRAVLSSGNKLASKNELLEAQPINNLGRYSLFGYSYQLFNKDNLHVINSKSTSLSTQEKGLL